MDMSHVLEKLFTFQESIPWTNKIVYNNSTQGKIYALVDRSLHIFDINWRVRINVLENIHEASITQCVWYARSQFYITSCNQGLIKCYSNIQMNDSFSNQKTSKNNSYSSALALLHTFNLHTKAVTGLKLHPTVPGLLISSSLDCTIRVLNHEALSQLFFVHLSSGINNIQVTHVFSLS
jgi:WD40 repeat protein